MGCGASSAIVDVEARDRNSAIERQLKEDEKAARNEIKLLLLGAGESGKSTCVKQMRMLHGETYTTAERDAFREIVFSNTIQSMRVLVDGVALLAIPIDVSCQPFAQTILDAPSQLDGGPLDLAYVDAVQKLWADCGIRAAYERRSELQLNDSAEYFFCQVDRLSAQAYRPTDEDILRARVKSTGISEVTVKVDTLIYRMFDVGGQRSERKKWIHCFEDVQALIFVASVSEYNQRLYEDEEVGRMEESLTLWESVANSRWFLSTTIVLFLNKQDLFRAKLERHPLGDYFDDYDGSTFADAQAFMTAHFLNVVQRHKIYSHWTTATSTEQMRFVTAAVHDTLLQRTLQEANFI